MKVKFLLIIACIFVFLININLFSKEKYIKFSYIFDFDSLKYRISPTWLFYNQDSTKFTSYGSNYLIKKEIEKNKSFVFPVKLLDSLFTLDNKINILHRCTVTIVDSLKQSYCYKFVEPIKNIDISSDTSFYSFNIILKNAKSKILCTPVE